MLPALIREAAGGFQAQVLRRLARLSDRRVGVVLVLHGVADTTGDRGRMIVPPIGRALLEQYLAHLARHYHLVEPSAILTHVQQRRRGQRIPVALTFDDDLACHADVTAPLLGRHGVPAAFFVSGASLDSPHRFWWEDLQVAIDRRLLTESDLSNVPPEAVHAAFEGRARAPARLAAAIEDLSPPSRAHLVARLRERAGALAPDDGLRRDAIRGLVDAGFEVGFHTVRHERLPDLADDALVAALQDGRDALELVTGRRLSSIAYPHGRADDRVAAVARRAGFEIGFTGAGHVVSEDADPLLLPRITPTLGGPRAFGVQIARLVAGAATR